VTIAVLIAQGEVERVSELWVKLLDPWVLIQFITFALVFAWIAGRLLGATKRSWRAVFVTGVSGWLVALAVAATVFRGDIEGNLACTLFAVIHPL
jgi:hypothetical protein